VEEHFYLLWPALLVFVILRRDLKKAAVVVAWMSIAAGLWRIADAQNQLTEWFLPDVPVHFRSDLRMDALLWGCFAAFLISDPKMEARLKHAFHQRTFVALVLAGLVCVARYSLLTGLWLPMVIPLLLVGTVLHPEWMVSRLLDHPWVRFIGRISYSLYLWQQLFLISGWEPRLAFQKFPQNLILTVTLALLSYIFVEKPCMNFGRKLSARIRSRKTYQCEYELSAH
jgi:peptidoglycan/LPS O-acetylase OafA/YrhL